VEVNSVYPAYDAAPLNDGEVQARGRAGTAWASAESPQEHAVTLTWPRPQRIGMVEIVWGQSDWVPRAYRLECRVDGKFVRVAPPQGSAEWTAAEGRHSLLRFAPILTDALRVVQSAGGGSRQRPNLMGMAELAAYEIRP